MLVLIETQNVNHNVSPISSNRTEMRDIPFDWKITSERIEHKRHPILHFQLHNTVALLLLAELKMWSAMYGW